MYIFAYLVLVLPPNPWPVFQLFIQHMFNVPGTELGTLLYVFQDSAWNIVGAQ